MATVFISRAIFHLRDHLDDDPMATVSSPEW